MSAAGPHQAGPGLRYSRARRLERASEDVRWLASRYGARPPGLFKMLFATRASTLLFFTVLALALAFAFVPLFERPGSSGTLLGARFAVAAYFSEGHVFVTLVREGGEELEAGELLVVEAALRDAARRPGNGTWRQFAFPFGSAAANDYRLSFASAGPKPASLRVRVRRGGKVLELELPVE